MVLVKKWTMVILYVYLILFSVLGLLIWINPYEWVIFEKDIIFKTFSFAFAAGGIGASLYGIRMLYYHSHLHDEVKGSKLKDEAKDLYLFDWNKIPGDDEKRLKEFLKKNFCVDWVEQAEIERPDNRTIKLSIKYKDEKKSLSLRLNDKKTKAMLTIGEVGTDVFIVEAENDRLNIYQDCAEMEFKWNAGWFWFYFSRPVVGAFLGFVVYVLLQGGLLSLSQPGSGQTGPSSDIIVYSYTVAIGLGWLAGYNVTDLIARLEKVATSLFGLEHEETPFDRLKRLAHSRGKGRS